MAQFTGTIELGVTTGNDADLIRNTNLWNGGALDGSTTGLNVTVVNGTVGLGNYGGNGNVAIAAASSTQFTVDFGAAGRANNHIPNFGGTVGASFTTTSDRLIVVTVGSTITYIVVPTGTQVNFVSGFSYTFVIANTLVTSTCLLYTSPSPRD